jgi:hypothetical protein
VTRRGRGSTGPGRPSVLPPGEYDPPGPLRDGAAGATVVFFHGDDGREDVFDMARLPLPGWWIALAGAVAQRTGPAGGLRTRTSAAGMWWCLGRWMRFLDGLPTPPADPGRLTAAHVEGFLRLRTVQAGEETALRDVGDIKLLLDMDAIVALVPPEARDALARRQPRSRSAGQAGYSDGEFERLLSAARADVARIRDRIAAGEDLVRRHRDGGGNGKAAVLADMAASGRVPRMKDAGLHDHLPRRIELAQHLFLHLRDLPPLMVLLCALTERNGETLKELPAQHKILDGRAVEVTLIKRRRGPRRWFETVTWEIGPAHRALHTPGGLYLLIHQLTARSRALCSSDRLFCAWRNILEIGGDDVNEHYPPFADKLWGGEVKLAKWAGDRRRPLLADAPEGGEAGPLQVTFNRIKTSTEVRRTRRLGGHLPSAAKSNTMQVLFRNYLGGDPVIIEWAHQVLGEALVDAEQTALRAHELNAAGGSLRVVTGPADAEVLQQEAGLDAESARRAADGELDTAWTACGDHAHPMTGKTCEASFLACFHCGNCLVTRDHLPRLLGLMDALAERRLTMSETEWWRRYGPAWAAIRHDILAKFSPAEREHAERAKPTDALLDLVEEPWEQL